MKQLTTILSINIQSRIVIFAFDMMCKYLLVSGSCSSCGAYVMDENKSLSNYKS